ncbi:hypothetical protein [Acinetobacter tandoii]|uniref:Uncharacterized protein n=1 Tax=Acinetobacter tandoii DSM 14970 = CIP 107469 TaxID=1120927 RepID=R9B737_9GAMM|nr:hypothetical protein [Acinetobacter tandoii]EOR08201.1 hypothetical protein I593_01556 [Acinetobacter tandoii DSM 14970 = CIP 107469]
MLFFEFISKNSTAIEAIVAILNLILIGFLTFRGNRLQNEVHTMEVFSRIQQESLFCQSLITDFIMFFEQRATTTSSYLKTLYDVGASDPDNEGFARISLGEYQSILEKLNNLKSSFEEAYISLTLDKVSYKTLQSKFIEITHLKSFLSNHSPIKVFNSCSDGHSSIWLEDEQKYDSAFKETNKVLIEINKKIEALK